MDVELLKRNFERRGFKTAFFATKEEAAAHLVATIEGELVGFGGSVTVGQLGLYELLAEKNEVVWHAKAENPAEARRKAQNASVYVLSANGVSETGVLVNIDGAGNRVSASLYGPKKVVYVVGRNKLAPTLEAALDRARNVASPKNCVRLGRNTPCASAGGERCFDCSSPERICNCFVFVERPNLGMEVEVVFVDEELGF